MLGTVVAQEWTRASRRGRLDMLRRAYASWLIIQFVFLFLSYQAERASRISGTDTNIAHPHGRFVVAYLDLFVVQNLVLIAIAAPAFAGGSLADEKSRGTLSMLLTSELTSADIVLGKWLSGVAQVLWAALPAVPLFCLVGGMSGIDATALGGFAVICVVLLLACSAISILAAVYSVQTRDTVLRVWIVGILGFFVLFSAIRSIIIARMQTSTHAWLVAFGNHADNAVLCLSPFYILDSAWFRGNSTLLAQRVATASIGWGLITAGSLTLSIYRLRSVFECQLTHDRIQSPRERYRPLRSVSDRPVLWKERVIDGLALFPRLRRIPCWMGCVLVGLLVGWQMTPNILSLGYRFTVSDLFIPLVASIVIGARASGSVCGERERQTWDSLLLSPLEGRELLRHKLYGILLAALPYFLTYVFASLFIALFAPIRVIVWKIVISAAAASYAHLFGAFGIWNSAKGTSTWRSLIATLVGGWFMTLGIHLGVGMLALVASLMVNAWIVMTAIGPSGDGELFPLTTSLFGQIYLLLYAIGLLGVFWLSARSFLGKAEKHVNDTERIGEAPAIEVLRSLWRSRKARWIHRPLSPEP